MHLRGKFQAAIICSKTRTWCETCLKSTYFTPCSGEQVNAGWDIESFKKYITNTRIFEKMLPRRMDHFPVWEVMIRTRDRVLPGGGSRAKISTFNFLGD